MFAKLARTGLLIAALGVAGCNDSSMKDFAPEANKPLPDKILADMIESEIASCRSRLWLRKVSLRDGQHNAVRPSSSNHIACGAIYPM